MKICSLEYLDDELFDLYALVIWKIFSEDQCDLDNFSFIR
jgi:hypothetical protein